MCLHTYACMHDNTAWHSIALHDLRVYYTTLHHNTIGNMYNNLFIRTCMCMGTVRSHMCSARVRLCTATYFLNTVTYSHIMHSCIRLHTFGYSCTGCGNRESTSGGSWCVRGQSADSCWGSSGCSCPPQTAAAARDPAGFRRSHCESRRVVLVQWGGRSILAHVSRSR